jgi:hypothetical protein
MTSCLDHRRAAPTGAATLAAVGALLVSLVSWSAPATGRELTLSKDSESGFLRLMHMAQTAQLGADVINANIGVDGEHVRVELVRRHAPIAVLRLTPKRSAQTVCKYFDITPGEGATASDVARVGKALDDVFTGDPFQILGHEESFGAVPHPTLTEAWEYGGWRAVLRALEVRMMVPASLEYTVGVIVLLALGVLASLLVLWLSPALLPDPQAEGRE